MNRHLLPILALALLVLAVFGRLVASPSALLVDGVRASVEESIEPGERTVGNDLTRLFLPNHLRIAAQVAERGRPSTWDPDGFGGRPRVGNPQAGLWYPPAWLAWWIGSPAALGWLTIGHLILAGVGTFWLARFLDLGTFASFVAAGSYALAPYVLAQVGEGHLPHVWAACWYPWAFLAFVRWRGSDEIRAGLALAPILTMCALTGHPQEAYYLVLAMSGWVGLDLFVDGLRRRGSRSSTRGGFWLLILALVVGLAAVEVVPVALAQAWTLSADRLSLSQASGYHVGALNLMQLLTPRALGGPSDYLGRDNYWETLLAFGWATTILAVVGATRSTWRAGVFPWILLAIAAIIFSSGKGLGLFAALYEVAPGMNRFRVPARALFLASLAVAVLAGFGVETLIDRNARLDWPRLYLRYRRLALSLAFLILGGSVAASISGVGVASPPGDLDRVLLASRQVALEPIFWVSLVGVGLAFAMAARWPGRVGDVAIAVGVLAIAELGWLGFAGVKVAPAEQFLDQDPIVAAIEQLDPERPFRIRAQDALYPDLNAVVAGLEKTNVNDHFQLRQAAQIYETLYPQFDPPWPKERGNLPLTLWNRAIRQSVLDRMNVAFLVAGRPPTDPLPWPVALSVTWRGLPFWIYRNPAPLPRAYVVPRAEPWPEELAVEAFPVVPPREAVLMPADPLGEPTGPRQPFTPARYESTDPDRVVVRVETGAPGLLVIADTWMPGWTASDNGRPATILRGDRAWRVIPLGKPGAHEVVLRYEAPGMWLGGVLTAASAMIWLAAMGVASWSRRGAAPAVLARSPRILDRTAQTAIRGLPPCSTLLPSA